MDSPASGRLDGTLPLPGTVTLGTLLELPQRGPKLGLAILEPCTFLLLGPWSGSSC